MPDVSAMTDRTLGFEIHLIQLPPASCGPWNNVEAGIQHGQEVLSGHRLPDDSMVFTGTLRLKEPAAKAGPVFLGRYAFGTPADRFLYLSWSGEENGAARQMFRRIKIPLTTITWTQVDQLRDQPGAVLKVTVSGTGRDGTPACATVPLLGGWTVGTPERS